jgi:hypothetical protein
MKWKVAASAPSSAVKLDVNITYKNQISSMVPTERNIVFLVRYRTNPSRRIGSN